jgi:hypothetical protein
VVPGSGHEGGVTLFRVLTREQVVDISRLLLDRVTRRLRGQRIDVRFSDEAVAHLAERGYEPEFGARPLRRTVQRLVENRLSRMVLDGTLEEGDSVVVSVKDERPKSAGRPRRGDGQCSAGADQAKMLPWISATVFSLGNPLDSVTTMTVGPNDFAASNAARTAAKTASSSPIAKLLRRPTATFTPSAAAAFTAASIAGRRCSWRSG